MLDLRLIRTQPDLVRELIRRRKSPVDFDKLLEADERMRALTAQTDALRQKRKGGGAAAGSPEARDAAVALRNEIAALEEELRIAKAERDGLLSWLPNLLADDTPIGSSDADNVEIQRWGDISKPDFELKTHEVIGHNLGVIDEERGTKVAGSGFYYFVGDGARLAWGMFSLALDYLAKRGFQQMFTPVAAKQNTLYGTGYLPFFSDQIFKIEGADLNLIGTSEQTMVGYYSDEILAPEKLPLMYTAFTPCFRTEAGSYGRETRGLFRQHQFHKVEQIVFCDPATSEEWLQKTVENATGILRLLEIPYRVVRVCDGDLGAPGYKKYDIEGWFAGFGSYRETHSCTSLTDFQTRRLNIRCKGAGGTFHPHTISSTMITDRALLALLENNQQADGSVRIPEALRPYVDGRTEIRPR
jgi:seryl-tRNA synthetase